MAASFYIHQAFKEASAHNWLLAGIGVAASILATLVFWFDVISTRININKLRVFKPSNERRIMRR
jgi:hypothetical protein